MPINHHDGTNNVIFEEIHCNNETSNNELVINESLDDEPRENHTSLRRSIRNRPLPTYLENYQISLSAKLDTKIRYPIESFISR